MYILYEQIYYVYYALPIVSAILGKWLGIEFVSQYQKLEGYWYQWAVYHFMKEGQMLIEFVINCISTFLLIRRTNF